MSARKGPKGKDAAAELIAESARDQTVRLQRQLDAARGAVRARDAQILELEDALGVIRSVEARTVPVVIPRREKASAAREGCAVILGSDWHAGETVLPAQVFGKNAYNVSVFNQRADRFAEAAAWLIRLNQKAFAIRRAVLWFGGDMGSGSIHDDLLLTNELSPVDELLCWLDACEKAARRIAREVEFLDVVCSYGNHGRMTHKPRVHTGAAFSFEVLGYKLLARRLADLKNVRVTVATGEHTYVDVFGWTVRFTHGDAVRYQGGVGGVTIPLKKAVHRWDTAKKADITCVGHFHQYMDMGNVVVNGSLIGYSPYTVRIAAEHEQPQQGFFVIDAARGKCQSTPMWVSERKAA